MKLIYPTDSCDKNDLIVFLAGPIQGARNWQQEAYEYLKNQLDEKELNITVANPRRIYLDGEFVYERQVDWETEFLNRASYNGVIIFW